jgi:hypothetical protein
MIESNALSARVFRDPENDLVAIVRAFQESDQQVWHIDRHVLDVTEDVGTDVGSRVSACAAGLTLLRKWSSQRLLASRAGSVLSEPYLLVDDGWLEGAPAVAPPHVYICIAADEEAFSPVQHEDSSKLAPQAPPALASLLTGKETVRRLSGAFEDEPGAWQVTLNGIT